MKGRELLQHDLTANTDLAAILGRMQQMGSSVDLNWGEDTGAWECSWISSGKRFTGWAKTPLEAVRATLRKVDWGEPL